MVSQADSKAGCIMVSKAGCIMVSSADAKAGCIMVSQADSKAGCIMVSKAGCIMVSSADAKAGCIMVSKAGCIMVSKTGVDETRLPESKRLFERASAWDMSQVKTHAVKKGFFAADEIDQIHAAYVRFVALAASHDDGAIELSQKVDDFWHAHILFTEDYAAFCQAVAGRFLHHRPTV
jgi:hypothetical protein